MSIYRRIAILGAGPSGLAVGKEALQAGVRPIIFDSSNKVGGIWNPVSNRAWSHSLKTNLSKFTCCYSDFHWSKDVDMYPSRADVHSYLSNYSNQFLKSEHFSLESTIKALEPVKDGRWQVTWYEHSNKENKTDTFDFVVVSTGFYSLPSTPLLTGLSLFPGQVIHSSEYTNPKAFNDKTVVVCGSSFSAIEIAADIARYGNKVYNILPKEVYILPRYIPESFSRKDVPFLPYDLAMFRRKPVVEPGLSERLLLGDEDILKSRGYFDRLLGGPIGSNETEEKELIPVHVAISDSYNVLVEANRVIPINGRVSEVTADGDVVITSRHQEKTKNEKKKKILSNIDTVILATGYSPQLSFLPSSLLSKLSYDPSDPFSPLLLDRDMFHPDAPNMAFVGMYRDPHFPAMDLQARIAVGTLTGSLPPLTIKKQKENIEKSRIRRYHKPRAQLPHNDYIGHLDSLGRELGVPVDEFEWRKRNETLIPSGFRDMNPTDLNNENEVLKEKKEREIDHADIGRKALEIERNEFVKGRRVAAAVFRALHGHWSVSRCLCHSSSPENSLKEISYGRTDFILQPVARSDQIERERERERQREMEEKERETQISMNTVGFHPSTRQAYDSFYDEYEYVYKETDTKIKNEIEHLFPKLAKYINISQEYIYVYNSQTDKLDIYFSNNNQRHQLYTSLCFYPTEEGWTAITEPVVDNNYEHIKSFCVIFVGVNIQEIQTEDKITGLQEIYTFKSSYCRVK